MGHMKKEDVQNYKLLHYLCCHKQYFPEKRFQYPLKGDPTALMQQENDNLVLIQN